MHVDPDPPVEVGEGVDEGGLPPTFTGAEGVEEAEEGAAEGEGAAEEEGVAGVEDDPEPADDPELEPPETNEATGGPGKSYVNPGL